MKGRSLFRNNGGLIVLIIIMAITMNHQASGDDASWASSSSSTSVVGVKVRKLQGEYPYPDNEEGDPYNTVEDPVAPLQVGQEYEIQISSTAGSSDIKPEKSSDGKSLTYTLTHKGASYMSLYFSSFNLQQGCVVKVSDSESGQNYEMSGEGRSSQEAFWARHVRGETVVFTLTCSSRNKGSEFVVSKYAAGFGTGINKTPLGPASHRELAICGDDDKENAKCYQPNPPAPALPQEHPRPIEYDKSMAVARLLITGRFACTGWLVSDETRGSLLFTNEHCITSNFDAINTDYEFMAEAPKCDDANCRLCHAGNVIDGAALVQDNATLDYALIRLDGNPAAIYGHLEIDPRAADVNEEIYIPQHPGGRAKELGIFSSDTNDGSGYCQIYGPRPSCTGASYSDVGYFCDTEGGSSGSPVMARKGHKVIALHHCANCANRGVPMDLIYPEIASLLPPKPKPKPLPSKIKKLASGNILFGAAVPVFAILAITAFLSHRKRNATKEVASKKEEFISKDNDDSEGIEIGYCSPYIS